MLGKQAWFDEMIETADDFFHEASDARRQAIEAEAEMRLAMMGERTASGQLRCAVAASGIDHRELAAQAGLSPKTLAKFLVGKASLDSEVTDRLTALLRQEQKPIGSSGDELSFVGKTLPHLSFELASE